MSKPKPKPQPQPLIPQDGIVLTGSIGLLESILPLFLTIRKLIEDKDIGEIVADTLIDSVKKVQFASIILVVTFYSNQKPPFTQKGFKRVICKVPDLKRGNLKWEIIKAAAGGANGYMGGRFRATANLSTGRQMQVFGNSEKEATQQLINLHSLSTSTITTLTCSEMKNNVGLGMKGDILYKESVRMYPAFCTILNTEKIKDEMRREAKENELLRGKTQSTTQGIFVRRKTRKIPLWQDKPPAWFDEEVNEAFLNRGKDDNTQR